jgi:uncharacterized repeat protein (TIGR01451 family)
MTKARAFTIAGLVHFTVAALLAMTFLAGQPGTALGSGMVITRTPTPTIETPTPPRHCILTCTKTGGPTEVLPGDEVTFVIRVCNEGDKPCKSIVIRDKVPHQLEDVSVGASQGAQEIAGNNVEAQIGNLSPDECAEVTIVARVRDDVELCTQFTNCATIGDDDPCGCVTLFVPCLDDGGGSAAQSGQVAPQAVVVGLLVMGAGLLAAGLVLGAKNRAQ